MTTQLFMRNYIDLINEMEQPQQLDEGVMDTIMGKFQQLKDRFMAIPGAAQALKQVEPYRDQIEAIVKNSKSGQEAGKAIKDLMASVAQKDTAMVTEIDRGGFDKFAGYLSLATSLGLVALMLLGGTIDHIQSFPEGSFQQVSRIFVAVAVPLAMILAAIVFFAESRDRKKNAEKWDQISAQQKLK